MPAMVLLLLVGMELLQCSIVALEKRAVFAPPAQNTPRALRCGPLLVLTSA
jgi:hypothetical protein